MAEQCSLPPEGWYCTRQPGHDGPCAAARVGFLPEFIDLCAACGYGAWRDGYPCNRCGGLEKARYVREVIGSARRCTCQVISGGHLVKGTAICPVHG